MRAMTKSWNKADRVLFLAFLVFLLALFVHLQLPHSVFASGFLFCAEAALVGGIADWFAVTALFRKPLGFPYHTAILPRRRCSAGGWCGCGLSRPCRTWSAALRCCGEQGVTLGGRGRT